MKLVLVLIVSICFLTKGFSQERVNREKLSFGKCSGILVKATGWAYNAKFGEWIDYENVISANKDFKEKHQILQGEWMMSRITQNFLKLQFKKLTFNGATYYVFIVERWSGGYEYPTLELDWYTFKEYVGYIYSEDEYQKLSNIESLVELKTLHKVSLGSKYDNFNEIKFLDLIQTELTTELSGYPVEYTFPIMKSKEGFIRFYIPERFSTYSNYDFENKYFETDLENFSKLFL
jgi:hypothetical protein